MSGRQPTPPEHAGGDLADDDRLGEGLAGHPHRVGRRGGEHEENERAHRAGPPRQLARKRSTHGAAGCAASSSSEPTCTRVPSCISTTRCPSTAASSRFVGDQDHRRPQRLEHAPQLLLQLAAGHRVERAERLVEEDDRRAEHQRPHEAHPLPLSSGELERPAAQDRGLEAHQPGELLEAPRPPVRGLLQSPRQQRHVVGGGQVREEPPRLKPEPHPPPERRARLHRHRQSLEEISPNPARAGPP